MTLSTPTTLPGEPAQRDHAGAALIQNPVLTGFHPDPSIVRVGLDYYLASSTFQWWPGVRLHHSRDLVHWEPIGYALTRPNQMDLVGVPDHAGIWAPCLSYDAASKLFYLVYTVVESRPSYFDDRNYLVVAKDPRGPWSDPVYLNGVGFDASMFHDDDGRHWLVQLTTDPRPDGERFNGIALQEYDVEAKALVGPSSNIFRGTHLGLVEGPHLYKRDGWYHLMTAEGGTSYEHAVTMARSRSLEGPYEVDPQNPMLTSHGDTSLTLQKAGHASLVDTPDGQWYLAHLCGRPLPGTQRCPLGRETSLQHVIWDDDGWLRLAHGGNRPSGTTPAPEGVRPRGVEKRGPLRIDFPEGPLHDELNTLRAPADPAAIQTGVRGDWLRLAGGVSLESLRRQSLVGMRLRDFQVEATTRIRFAPESHHQMAGMLLYYDTHAYHYLYLTRDDAQGIYAAALTSDRGQVEAAGGPRAPLGDATECRLRAMIDDAELRFSVAVDGQPWRPVGPALDMGLLADDYAEYLGFTGTFIALAAQDFSGHGVGAEFEHLAYRPLGDAQTRGATWRVAASEPLLGGAKPSSAAAGGAS